MRSFSKALAVSLSVSIGALTNIASTGGAPLALENSKMVGRMMALPAANNHAPPPVAGIKLLEDIFTRMHSLPQLAINKSKSVGGQQAQNSALTDPMLAIKPKEVYRGNQQKIAYAPQQARSYSAPIGAKDADALYGDEEQDRKRDEAAPQPKAKAAKKQLEKTRSYAAARSLQIVDGRPVVRDFREAPIAAASPAPASAASYQAGSGGYAPGQNAVPAVANSGGSVFDHPGFIGLRNSINRFAGAVGTLQNAQQNSDMIAQSQSEQPAYQQRMSPLRRTNAIDKAAPHSVAMASQTGIQEYSATNGKTAAARGAMYQSQNMAQGAPQSPPAEPQLQQATSPTALPGEVTMKSDVSIRPPEAPSVYRTTHEYSQQGSNAPAKPVTMAMQVPNVISGIPLVRLGENESTAQSALSTVGSVVKQEYKTGWRVYSVTKAGTRETAAQLYVKHGMVEGMRVFDATLMPGDLGVCLGDNLTSVKSKFGEPAFFISEPNAGHDPASAGLNYVYPISQVSFELARVTKRGAPQVVSMLLFNVK